AAEAVDTGRTSVRKPNATCNRKLLVIINDFSRQTRKRKCSPSPAHRVHRHLHGIHQVRQLLPTPVALARSFFAATINETEILFCCTRRIQHAVQRRKAPPNSHRYFTARPLKSDEASSGNFAP